jgi:methyl-accepting chemotaxis protein
MADGALSNLAGARRRSIWRSCHSIRWGLVAPVPLLIIVAMTFAWLVLPHLIAANATSDAIRAALQTAAQFKTIRAYYTEYVVSKVVKSGAMKASVAHKSEDNAIPLPATMVHDLSGLLSGNDTTISLYSKYPFPNRKDRQLDAFQEEAWNFLTAHPTEVFSRRETRDGKEIVRAAVADTMTVQACVDCHNKTPSSPKTDWKLGEVRGVLEVASVIDGQLAEGASLSRSLMAAAAAIGVILIVISLLAAQRVTGPLKGIVAAMGQLAAGRFEITLPGLGRKDEIGEIAASVEAFKAKAEEKARLAADEALRRERAEAEAQAKVAEERAKAAGEQASVLEALAGGLKSLAEGKVTFRLAGAFTQAYQQIKDDFNMAVAQLQETLAGIRAAAREVAMASAEISTGSADLSRRTEQQASSLEETAAALNEITATVHGGAEGARHARDVVSAAKADAEKSGMVVRSAVEAMKSIDQSSKQISQIIGVIDEIAFQTNLLALNAGVEAARAGEAGRGFAVVASEVRALAQRSAEAAKEIKSLIATSAGQVDRGVGLVEQTGEALERIVVKVAEINGVVAAISASAEEQATGLKQVNSAVHQMDQVTQQNAAMAEEATAAAHSMTQQTESLRRLIGRFDVGEEEPRVVPSAPRSDKTLSRRSTTAERVGAIA